MKCWIFMNWFYSREDVLISVTGCQIERGDKFKRPGNGTVLKNCFSKFTISFVFSWSGKLFLSSLLNLQMGFVCLIVSKLKFAQSCRPQQESPLNPWLGSGEHVPPLGGTIAKSRGNFVGIDTKLSVLCLCLLISYKNANLLIQNLADMITWNHEV